jgi:hypothetical protein
MRRATYYRIQIAGELQPHWSDWFDDLTISHADGNTILAGFVADQAALYGLVIKIRDLGLTLLSLEAVEEKGGDDDARV